jgi:hypothetical protein
MTDAVDRMATLCPLVHTGSASTARTASLSWSGHHLDRGAMTDIPVFTAHDIPDLINTLPTLFGFTPEDSIMAIATSGPRHRVGFRLRMDLPAMEHIEPAAGQIVAHLQRQGAEGAIIIAVTPRTDVASRLVAAIEQRLGSIRPVVSAWADGTRYWTTFDDGDSAGHPYETSDHHLAVVHAIASGQVILPNRAALAATFDPVAGERRLWLNRAVDTVAEQVAVALTSKPDEPVEEVGMAELAPALAAAAVGRPLTDDQALRLAVWATTVPVRDALWALITPDTAREMVGLWTHVARCAPPWLAPPALTLAGFASWLSGDGARALIAIERALDIDPEYALAGMMLQMLESGIPPTSWRPSRVQTPKTP